MSLFLLSTAMFALGMDAYVLAGLVPDIARSLDVAEGSAAQVVTAFTLSYAIAAPVLAASLAGKSVKRILSLAMALFVTGNLISVFASDYWILIASRCVAGVGAGTFAPVAAATAGSLVPKEKKGRALGVILGGMGTGTVIGVPVGIQIANVAGWQLTLLVVAIIATAAIVGILSRLPAVDVAPPPSLNARLQMLTNPRVAVVVTVTLFTAIASLGLYTFMAPVLAALSMNLDSSLYFWAWGIGGVVGAFSVGHVIDHSGRPGIVLLCILIALVAAITLLPVSASAPAALSFVPILIWGAMGWSSLAPQQHVLLDLQPEHGSIAVALNSSANYLGSAIGTMVGGAIITTQAASAGSLPEFAAIAGLVAIVLQAIIVITQLNTQRSSTDATTR
ncbi:MFS transporter [Salinisphaera sp. RV14]|uniref:MFS transporter n=1 Tax=Salinisphaera sp. RV14 TaxID=3454140 RepID=UPI003F8494CF